MAFGGAAEFRLGVICNQWGKGTINKLKKSISHLSSTGLNCIFILTTANQSCTGIPISDVFFVPISDSDILASSVRFPTFSFPAFRKIFKAMEDKMSLTIEKE
jgi:hypothetical protein